MAYNTSRGPRTFGDVTSEGNVSGSGTLQIVGNTFLGGDLEISGTVDHAGAATFTNISGSGTLEMVGNTFLGGTLNVTGNADFDGTVTCDTSLTIDSTTISAAEIGYVDGVTAGTAAANKAVVLDGSKNIATIGTVGCGAITSTGNSSFAGISGSSTLQAVGATTLGSTLSVSGNVTIKASTTLSGAAVTATTLAGTSLALQNGGITSAGTVTGVRGLTALTDLDIGNYDFRAKSFTSDVATGTAPLTISSTTKVANLNVDKLDGNDWTAPGAIGATTPGAAEFTTISGSSTLQAVGATTLGNTLSVSGNVTMVSTLSGAGVTATTLQGTSLALQNGGVTTCGDIAGASNVSGSGTLQMVGAATLGNTLSVSGTVSVAQKIEHAGDTDTYIEFTDDNIEFKVGNVKLLDLAEASVDKVTVGNGGDVDFQVKTVGQNFTIFAEGSSDKVGICTDSPSDTLTVAGTISGSSTLQAVGNTFLGATLNVTGATTLADDLTATGDTNTFSSANSTDPLVIIKNTTNDAKSARLRFIKDKGAAGAANDEAGVIEFFADDANQDNICFASITGSVSVHTNGQEGGKLTLKVASHDGEQQPGLVITDGSAEDEVDVTIGNGADSLVTIAGDLDIPNGGFALGSDADGDIYYRNSNNLQRLAKGDDDQVLTLASGVPTWAAASAGSTFTNLSGSGTFQTVGNAFFGGTLNVTGNADFDGTITCDTSLTIDSTTISAAEIAFVDGVTAGTAAANKAVVLDGSKNIATIGTIGCGAITTSGDLSATGDTNTFSSANSTDPLVIIKNTTNDAKSARLRFIKDKGAAGAANDEAGVIEFFADDANQDNICFASITGAVAVHTNGQEGGRLTLKVASHDGEQQPGLVIVDGSAEDEVDVTIGNGADSLVTIAGDLDIPNGGFALGSDADGDIYYRNSNNLQRLAKGDDDQVLTLASGLPSWADPTAASTFTNLSGSGTFQVVGNAFFGGTLNVTGNADFNGTITCDDSITIDSITITDTEIGYLDGLTAGTAAATKAVVLDGSKNIATIGTIGCGAITTSGDLAATGDTNTFSSANSTDPLVIIKNTTNDAKSARLRFIKDKGAAGAANDEAGVIEFFADDANQDNICFASVTGAVAVHTNGQEGGRLTLKVASNDGEQQPGLVIVDGDAEDEVDVTLGNGASSVTTVSGLLTAVGVVSGANGTFDALSGVSLALQNGGVTACGDIAGAGNVSGSGTLQMVGNAYLGANVAISGNIEFEDVASIANDTARGEIAKFGTGTLTTGKLYYLHTGSAWLIADASIIDSGSDALVGIALGSSAVANGLLLRGYFDMHTYLSGTYIPGRAVYMGANGAKGYISTYQPSGSGDTVRIMGHACNTSNVIYFNPSPDWIEL